MGASRSCNEGEGMTSTHTDKSGGVARGAAAAIAIAILSVATIAPAAARSDEPERKPEPRSAEATSTVQDVSGLTVTRTWKIDKRDPNTLVTTISAQNATPAPITTSIVEPIPTTSLTRITFRPLKMQTSSIPGLGRFEITVASGATLEFGYTARLTKDKSATAQNRLDTAKNEMEATIPSAQPTDADRAIAATRDRYVGPVSVTDFSSVGVNPPPPAPTTSGTNILRLTPATPMCRVVARGCRFSAQDSFTSEPKLAALDPAANSLVSTGAADLPQSGLTCGGADASAVMTKTWTFDPTGWRLSWSGWEVSQGQYTVVSDLSAAENGRCYAASVHMVLGGTLNADPVPTIRG
jgi:hypothetical protein